MVKSPCFIIFLVKSPVEKSSARELRIWPRHIVSAKSSNPRVPGRARQKLSLSLVGVATYPHTHTSVYIYIMYIYICVCVYVYNIYNYIHTSMFTFNLLKPPIRDPPSIHGAIFPSHGQRAAYAEGQGIDAHGFPGAQPRASQLHGANGTDVDVWRRVAKGI